jgi:hypothetical protein
MDFEKKKFDQEVVFMQFIVFANVYDHIMSVKSGH